MTKAPAGGNEGLMPSEAVTELLASIASALKAASSPEPSRRAVNEATARMREAVRKVKGEA